VQFGERDVCHCRVRLTVETRSPDHDVETPPDFPPLRNAMTDEEHTAALQVLSHSQNRHKLLFCRGSMIVASYWANTLRDGLPLLVNDMFGRMQSTEEHGTALTMLNWVAHTFVKRASW
jgi:hypothetical protein